VTIKSQDEQNAMIEPFLNALNSAIKAKLQKNSKRTPKNQQTPRLNASSFFFFFFSFLSFRQPNASTPKRLYPPTGTRPNCCSSASAKNQKPVSQKQNKETKVYVESSHFPIHFRYGDNGLHSVKI
jgi:hypothetical protein